MYGFGLGGGFPFAPFARVLIVKFATFFLNMYLGKYFYLFLSSAYFFTALLNLVF